LQTMSDSFVALLANQTIKQSTLAEFKQ